MRRPGKLSGVRVSDIMTPHVISINENDAVSFVIKLFSSCHISGAPVENIEGEYVGVLSKTDLFHRRVLEHLERHGTLDDLPVKSIMNSNQPLVVEASTTVEKAAELMLEHHIHRVFITAKGEMIGVVSSYDVLKVVAKAEEQQAVSPEEGREQCLLELRTELQKKKARKSNS
jgi:CBS domain-containing protein